MHDFVVAVQSNILSFTRSFHINANFLCIWKATPLAKSFPAMSYYSMLLFATNIQIWSAALTTFLTIPNIDRPVRLAWAYCQLALTIWDMEGHHYSMHCVLTLSLFIIHIHEGQCQPLLLQFCNFRERLNILQFLVTAPDILYLLRYLPFWFHEL